MLHRRARRSPTAGFLLLLALATNGCARLTLVVGADAGSEPSTRDSALERRGQEAATADRAADLPRLDRGELDQATERSAPDAALKPDLLKPDAPPKPDVAPKSDLPKPDLPKPDLPKPDLPKPDLPKPDLPKPDLLPKDLPCLTPPSTTAPTLARAGIPAGGHTPYLALFAWNAVTPAPAGYQLAIYPGEGCPASPTSLISTADTAHELSLTATGGGLKPSSFRVRTAGSGPCPPGPWSSCSPVVVGSGFASCHAVPMVSCTAISKPLLTAITGGCRIQYPPTVSQPCPVPTPGTRYYLGPSGSDSADGKSPDTAWLSLCHALASVPAGSSLLVAGGEYLSSTAFLDKPVTVKAGYSADFSSWDPDANPSVFYGQLLLYHPGAVWAGFRMIARHSCSGCSVTWHKVTAGTVVRNYFEGVTSGAGYFTLLELSPCEGDAVRLRCNDVYLKESGNYGAAIAMTGAGLTLVDSNRICAKGTGGLSFFDAAPSVGGTGVVRRVISNSISECDRYDIFHCANGREVEYTLVNNTLFPAAVYGKTYCGPLVRYRLVNNIIGGGAWNLDEQSNGKAQVTEARGNLSLSALTLNPAPLSSVGNDWGSFTPAQVFQNPTSGDYSLLSGGPAVGKAENLYGAPLYGWPTMDLAQWPRPAIGSWDRGALKTP